MKAILSLLLLGLTLITFTQAFYIFDTSQNNINILLTSQQSSTTLDDSFNEVEALGQFLKGILNSVKVTPSDSVACLKDNNGAMILFEYYYGLALVAGGSSEISALDAARDYISTIGARKLKKLPNDFSKCLSKSKDFAALSKNLKVDPSSEKFKKAFSSFAAGNVVHFQTTFSAIYQAIIEGKFFEAGNLYGTFCKTAALRVK